MNLRDRHRGEDAWVIGSGSSLDYLDPTFLDGRLTIGVNEVALRWTPTRYTVTKYHDCAERTALAFPDRLVIAPRFLHGNRDAHVPTPVLPPNVVLFDHLTNRGPDFDAVRDWPTAPDQIVVSWSTITTAMHLAAYMGAANIILVGHDCGRLDGRAHVAGYPPPQDPDAWLPARSEDEWLVIVEGQTLAVRAELALRYGVRVYSLSPFLGPNLDGVRYERGAVAVAA